MRRRIPHIILFAAVALVFARLGGVTFVNWDDDRFLVDNPLFHGPVLEYVKAALLRVQFEAYQPLHLLSYLPDRLLWPDSAVGFRAFGVAIYAVAVAGLFTVVRRSVGWVGALVATLVFALHPLRAESVAWIGARKDVVALLFVVAALWAITHAHERRRRGESTARFELFEVLAFVFTVLAILAKSSAMVTGVLVFCWRRWIFGDALRVALKRTVPHFLVGLGAAIFVSDVWGQNALIAPSRAEALPIDVAGTIGFYLDKLFLPRALAPIYAPVPTGFRAMAGLTLVLVVVAAVAWRRLPSAARFAVVGFFGCLLPFSNLVPLYFRFADRYSVFAGLACVWPMARGVEALRARGPVWRRSVLVAGFAIAGVLGIAAHRQSAIWNTSLDLWSHASQAQPGAMFNGLKLGETFRKRGDHEAAARAYIRAVDAEPKSVLPLVALFETFADREIAAGRLAREGASAWTETLKSAVKEQARLQALIDDVQRANCLPCAQSLLWLALHLYPQDDQNLVAMCALAMRSGHAEIAWVYLLRLSDRSTAARVAGSFKVPDTAMRGFGLAPD